MNKRQRLRYQFFSEYGNNEVFDEIESSFDVSAPKNDALKSGTWRERMEQFSKDNISQTFDDLARNHPKAKDHFNFFGINEDDTGEDKEKLAINSKGELILKQKEREILISNYVPKLLEIRRDEDGERILSI